MNPITIQLESLNIPYSEWVNPYSKDMLTRLDGFANQYGLYEQVGLPRQYALMGHSLVNDYMFPRADPAPLYVTGLMMVYFFLFDHIYDVNGNNHPAINHLRTTLAEGISQILKGEPVTHQGDFVDAAAYIFEYFQGTDSDWLVSFKDELSQYMAATLRGKQMATDADRLTLDAYLDIRQHDSGGWWSAYLIEYAHNLYLTPAQRADNDVRAAVRECMFTCSLINDLFSYAKEKTSEENPFNAVFVVLRNEHLPESHAYNRIVGAIQQHLGDFQALAASLESYNDPALNNYVQGLREFISGVWYWHQKCGLYVHPESPFVELRSA